MFLSAFFTTGRLIFMAFFIIAFIALMVYSYRKDANNHQRYYKNAAKRVIIYGGLIILIFVAIRFITGH